MYPFGSKKNKILLIEPPFYRFFDYERWHYPITLTLIATHLNKKGYKVKVYDVDKPTNNCHSLNRIQVRNKYYQYGEALKNKNHYIWEEIKNTILEYKPDIVGITSVTPKIYSADTVAKICKEINNKIKIILGGPHIQGMRIMFPNYNFGEHYDYVIENIPNLVDITPNKKLILNYQEYKPKQFSTILTSTGCPNKCTFCCNSYLTDIVYRNLNSVEEEISELVYNHGIDTIHLVDDCIFSYTKRFYELVNILYKYDLQFNAASRIMSLTKEKIKNFQDKNGLRVHVGIESGSQRILNLIKKRLKLEEAIKRTKWLNDYNVNWQVFFMVGFPFETFKEIQMTESTALQIEPTFISLNRFTPYPGTEIARTYFKNFNFDFKHIYQLTPDSCIKLGDKKEIYIENMYNKFNQYNEKSKQNLEYIKNRTSS